MDDALSLFILDEPLYEAMLLHVLTCLPEEACGLLGGQKRGTEAAAQLLIPVENELHSPVRFRMNPMEQLAAFKRFDELGMELVGIFHSHPAGPAAPSQTDLAEFVYPGTAFCIWSPDGDGWKLRAFSISGDIPGVIKPSVAIPIQVSKP